MRKSTLLQINKKYSFGVILKLKREHFFQINTDKPYKDTNRQMEPGVVIC